MADSELTDLPAADDADDADLLYLVKDPAGTPLDRKATVGQVRAGLQPSDADLTAIAALTTTAFGRSLLEIANASAGRTVLSAAAQADLDTESTARANADSALDGRLDTIEALGALATDAELTAHDTSPAAHTGELVPLAGGVSMENPAGTSGGGVILQLTDGVWSVDVPTGQTLSGYLFQHHAIGADGMFYGLQIDTEADTIDTAAGLAIVNTGRGDNLYLSVKGKSGAASAPTGLGVDLNRGAGSAEHDDENSGLGVAVFDWSSTDQGTDGPRGLYLAKANNKDSQHWLAHLEGNRQLIVLEPEAAASISEALVQVLADGTTERFAIRAGGDAWHAQGRGVLFDMSADNDAAIYGNGAILETKIGSTAHRWMHNNGSTVLATLFPSGYLDVTGGLGFAQTSYFAAGANLSFDGTTGTKIGLTGSEKIGFYGATPVVKPTGVAVTAAGVHAALVTLGLIAA